MPMDMSLPKFDIYQAKVSDFFQKKKFFLMSGPTFALSDVTSSLPDSLSELKK